MSLSSAPRRSSPLSALDDATARADESAREPGRLKVLRRADLMDAGLQPSLQRYVRLAANLTRAPKAAVSLVGSEKQYFCASVGMAFDSTPLERSYCKHVVADDRQLVVEDALADSVFRHHAATVEDDIRAYLGSPVTVGGARVGALCAIDTVARTWNADARQLIDDLAVAVATDMELRLQTPAQGQTAITDSLTGLRARGALPAVAVQALQARGSLFLGMFDLDGFMAYNAAFGHVAGDDLLRRLAARLRDLCGPTDRVFRMGGDEFCMVTYERERLLMARDALRDRGPGFEIGASLGIVKVPEEARDIDSAIMIADQRMYSVKPSRSLSVDYQVSQVLERALAERYSPLGRHSHKVCDLALRTARELGVTGEGLRSIEMASRLHDIGKLGISDSVLKKAGALDDEQWQHMRCHTIIGERIIAGAPSLEETARLVRSSHERFDGGGYPDGLSGDAIPLGARIILACDAYDAMTEDRDYRRAQTHEDACAELTRHAGTQFDPMVIRALLSVLGRSEQS
jgi:diguanylate cyclase (GGDEF)-like protein